MAILTFTVTITCVLFWIIGVHTETSRVLMAMAASLVILFGSGLAIPAVTVTAVRGGPARDANGEFLRDARGQFVYTREYARAYAGTEGAANSILYLSGSILIAGGILLVYRFLAGGLAADRNMRVKKDDASS